MANLTRSSKSPSDWTGWPTISPLRIRHLDFFSRPRSTFGRHIIDSPIDADNVSDSTYQYLTHLDLATQENMPDNFSRETLRIAERGLVLISRFIIPLMICGDYLCSVETSLCLLNREAMILLILRQGKPVFNFTDEPQVIAEAIAAYQHNNENRQTRGLLILDAMSIPCITVSRLRPTFYLVPVTKALSDAVATGRYPKAKTKVACCFTIHSRRVREGMETPAYRRVGSSTFCRRRVGSSTFCRIQRSCETTFLVWLTWYISHFYPKLDQTPSGSCLSKFAESLLFCESCPL